MPKIVKKHQTCFQSTYDKTLSLSSREIVAPSQEMYGADVYPALISKVTDAVLALAKYDFSDDSDKLAS